MAESEIRMSGGGKTFRRGMETSGALPALLRVHGAGRFAVPGLGIKIIGLLVFMAICDFDQQQCSYFQLLAVQIGQCSHSTCSGKISGCFGHKTCKKRIQSANCRIGECKKFIFTVKLSICGLERE
jgi:hypothetical protein